MHNYKTGKQRSVMKHQFSQVPKAEIQRSSFDRSHGHSTTFDAGLLIPIFLDEVLPGDTFNLKMTGFARMATPLRPLMDNAYMDTHWFFVPTRLIWDNWEKFNGAQTNPGDSTDFTIPKLNGANLKGLVDTIFDYMGLPVAQGAANPNIDGVNALPLRAYNLIYNEWFRDQNLQNSLPVETDDGPDSSSAYGLVRRGKRHDYFTSCLPFPQKGDSVSIPLGSFAPVIPEGDGIPTWREGADPNSFSSAMNIPASPSQANTWDGTNPVEHDTEGPAEWDDPALQADLTNASAATINMLRQSFQIQRLLERDARGGTRYTEVIRAHFGVTSPDARLQRPEYLGGGTSDIIINPVPQTSSTDATTPQGNLAAVGTVEMVNHGFTKSFTEHGYIIGLVSVRADLRYQQGLNRLWSRDTRFDFYWPALAHIGEQAVLSKEIFHNDDANDDDVFGYQERFAEYRYKPSQISGKFRSTQSTPLDIWHLAQEFSARPVLNSAFIEENPPFDRVIATPEEPHFIADFYFKLHCARPMPLYGVPGLIDHF